MAGVTGAEFGIRLENRISATVQEALASLPSTTIGHDARWHKVLTAGAGFCVGALVVHDGDRIGGVLPFVRKRRMGRRLFVCLPLTHDTGFAHEPWVDPARIRVRDHLWPLEVHADTPFPDTSQVSHHTVTVLDMADVDTERALLAKLRGNQRRQVVRAQRAGFTVAARTDVRAFEQFAELQALTRHRQGAPTYPSAFFPVLARELGSVERAAVHLVSRDNRAVAGVVFIYHRRLAWYAYAASLPDRNLWAEGVNQLALWDAIRTAWQRGCVAVDFGSSPNTQPSLRAYKERFGGLSKPLVHRSGGAAQGHDVAHDGPLVRVGEAVLKRTPLPIFRAVSPVLLRMVL